jgi:flagellar hook-length control protein FliK
MSIQLVSASMLAGNPPAAGSALESATGADGFSGLMGALLAGAEKGGAAATDLALLSGKPEASALNALLRAGLARLTQQPSVELARGEAPQDALAALSSLAGQIAPDVLPSSLPDELQPLPESEDLVGQSEEEAAISCLGALSTPVEASRGKTLLRLPPETRGQRADAETAGMNGARIALALTGGDAEVLSQKSANLATDLAAEAGDFAQILRENVLSGQPWRPLQAGVFANPTDAGGGGIRRDALTTPLASPAWAQEFGEKIVWMAKNDQHLARLSLYPAHLGPLSVTLNLDADKATAVFVAATQEARQAIEDALPRLREMLAAAGVSLGQTDVGAQERQTGMFDEQRAQHAALRESRNRLDKNATAAGDETILEARLSAETSGHLRRGAGMVDLFA